MVCRLGMSENVGPISYDSRQDHVFLGEELVRSQSHGAETLKKIDEEVRKILGDGFERARKLIGENKDQVEAITRALLEYEVLSGTEVSGIIAGRSIEEIKAEAEAAKEARETDIPSPEKEEEGVVESEEKMDEGDLPAEGEFAY